MEEMTVEINLNFEKKPGGNEGVVKEFSMVISKDIVMRNEFEWWKDACLECNDYVDKIQRDECFLVLCKECRRKKHMNLKSMKREEIKNFNRKHFGVMSLEDKE